MKIRIAFLLLITSIFSLAVSANGNNSKGETGFLLSHGYSFLMNGQLDMYYIENPNAVIEFAPFYRRNLNKLALKTEFTQRYVSSQYNFNDDYHGRVVQSFVGMNLKCSYSEKGFDDRTFELFLGAGIYTLYQKRVPDYFSGLKEIEDGFAPYWGLSIEAEFSYSIPVGKNRVGMAWRLFAMPNATFFNRKDTPEFYHMGTTLAMFTSF